MLRKTKIVCTLGPASEKKEVMRTLIQAGLNVARFNFSHGDYEEHGKRFDTVHELNKELGTYVATMLDTKGPEIRTNEFDGKVEIKKGSEVRIAFTEVLGNENKFSVTYKGLYDDVKVGELICVDDGYLTLEIIKKDEKARELVTVARNTHIVKSRRGINVPNVVLNMPFISDKDRKDIEFAATKGYDFVAASFVRRASDVEEIRKILDQNGGERIQIIAKIENQEGIDNLDEIIEVSDGIMVARGDLGIEIAAHLVPPAQSLMIDKCLEAGKIVIVATQMLESMQKNPRPTRAEVSDVYNAVIEGTSATMLSGESAAGDYPYESVEFMARIDVEAEKHSDEELLSSYYEGYDDVEVIAKAAVNSINEFSRSILVADGIEVAKALSKYHPDSPIIALVNNHEEARSLAINYGVYPVLSEDEASSLLDKLNSDDEGLFVLSVNNEGFIIV